MFDVCTAVLNGIMKATSSTKVDSNIGRLCRLVRRQGTFRIESRWYLARAKDGLVYVVSDESDRKRVVPEADIILL